MYTSYASIFYTISQRNLKASYLKDSAFEGCQFLTLTRKNGEKLIEHSCHNFVSPKNLLYVIVEVMYSF